MIEQDLEIPSADGPIPTFVTRPEEGGPHPTVIFFMDALGIREELKDMARRLGTVGYYVMLPNLFWRFGGPSFDPLLLPSKGPDPEMMRLNTAYTHALCLADTAALLAHAAADPATRDPVGTVGYCMGGRHALAAAGEFPDRVHAMVSLHAGFLVTDRPDSAHLKLTTTRAACYFGIAADDPVCPPAHHAVLADEIARHRIDGRIEHYSEALHGFTFPTRYCYHKPSAERSWERTFALFRRQLDK